TAQNLEEMLAELNGASIKTEEDEAKIAEYDEVVAAISMALAAYMGDNVHDNESGVLTITYTNKHWNNLNK
ncbi:MAG: hypothetical protein IKT53_03180, partial [Bacteroidaceae bacterium]|nr:hypothetical protein [Bacteroidaceae bacterium]